MAANEPWTLPLSVDTSGELGGKSHGRLADRLRLILEVAPGERPLLPEFGCALHRMSSIDTARERQIAAALAEEALDRWAPWARVSRVDVTSVSADRVGLVISSATEKMELEIERAATEREDGRGTES
jgi:phage baseplate assembly protein W